MNVSTDGGVAESGRVRRVALVRMLGGALVVTALLWTAKGPPTSASDLTTVRVTVADAAQVHARWQRTWSRPPTPDEFREALNRYVEEEILFREAMARDLDEGDPTVRVALVNKIRMMAVGLGDEAAFSDDEMDAYFSLRRDRYRQPARVSFSHVYVSRDRRGDEAEAVAAGYLEQLRTNDPGPEEAADLGDPLMLDPAYAEVSVTEIARLFGPAFASAVEALSIGGWEGPVESAYGLHLVRVRAREPARVPDWREVRDRVVVDMRYEARQQAEDRFVQEVASRYRVEFDDDTTLLLNAGGE